MILITGGAHQGKFAFAREHYGINEDNTVFGGDDFTLTEDIRCINGYHALVKSLLEKGEDPVSFTERLLSERSDLVILTDEIGSGIVPIEKSDRVWREAAGRCGCIIAAASSKVVRLVCGIPTVIKEEKK